MNKWPRHFAEEILKLREEERSEALKAVPEHLREWVEFYVREYEKRVKRS